MAAHRTLALVAGIVLAGRTAYVLESGAEVQEGDLAPSIEAAHWLNVDPGQEAEGPPRGGRPTLVRVSATWCGPCRRAMPSLQEEWERYVPRGAAVVMISDETPAVLERYLRERDYTFPVACDAEGRTLRALGARYLPMAFVIGRDGRVLYAGFPEFAEEALRRALGLPEDAAEARRRHEAARAFPEGDAARRALEDLLAVVPRDSDEAVAWRREYACRYPLSVEELRSLVLQGRHETALDALLDRDPGPNALAEAARSAQLTRRAGDRAAEEERLACAALLLAHWVFPRKPSRDPDSLQEALGPYLTASSFDRRTRRRVSAGVEGRSLRERDLVPFARRRLARALLLETLSRGETPSIERVLAGAAERETARMAELRGRHGD